jgi:hypothetical protein
MLDLRKTRRDYVSSIHLLRVENLSDVYTERLYLVGGSIIRYQAIGAGIFRYDVRRF